MKPWMVRFAVWSVVALLALGCFVTGARGESVGAKLDDTLESIAATAGTAQTTATAAQGDVNTLAVEVNALAALINAHVTNHDGGGTGDLGEIQEAIEAIQWEIQELQTGNQRQAVRLQVHDQDIRQNAANHAALAARVGVLETNQANDLYSDDGALERVVILEESMSDHGIHMTDEASANHLHDGWHTGTDPPPVVEPPDPPPVIDPPPVVDPPIIPSARILGINTDFVGRDKGDATPWITDRPYLNDGDGPLDPEYTRLMTPIADTIRYLNWYRTNDDMTTYTSLDQMNKNGDDTWRDMLNKQIDLANAVGADFWFNVPFEAQPSFTRAAVALIREGLHPEQQIIIEWSNENWNSGMGTYKRIRQITGEDLGGDAFFQLWADRCTVAFTSARQADPDVICTIAGQTANSWVLQQVYKRVTVPVDATAIAFYIGTGSSTWDGVTNTDQLIDASIANWSGHEKREMQRHFAWADTKGLPTFGYEGGQHIVATYVNGEPVPWQVDLTIAAQDNPRITAMMDLPLDEFLRLGGTRPVVFDYLNNWNKHGAWGLARDLGRLETSKKYLWAVRRSLQ